MHPPKTYLCRKIDRPLNLTGRLDDPQWERASWTDDFLDIQGESLPKPRFMTRAKMLWDDEFFYIGAELEEPHVWGTLTEHDSVIFHDNDFEVFIDPNGDNHEYYEFEINALGTYWDLLLTKPYRDQGSPVNGWEIPGLKTAVFVHGTLNDPTNVDNGWTVEIAFPWKALGECAHKPVPPKLGDCWRVNFSRVQWEHQIIEGKYKKTPKKPEDNWVWSPQFAIDMHRPEHWGIVQFCSDKPIHNFEEELARWQASRKLMKVYWAQQAHRKDKGRYADSLDDLKPYCVEDPLAEDVVMKQTISSFECSTTVMQPSGDRKTFVLNGDSRFFEL
ncbi:MAG: carbohydrate-binding family 9-like protein [Fimbriimonadaceae bacterium]|nr:carbohydrate-binding family 9-like protein [Fimbriimonadaceae bacterium]